MPLDLLEGLEDPARVMVIESPSPDDYFHGRREGHGHCELLRLSEVPHKYREVTDRAHLRAALAEVELSRAKYVHISCHGASEGIVLTSGESLTWDEFHDLVWHDSNEALKRKVLVFSACEVGKGVGVLLKKHSTFCARIVAPTREISWTEGLAAYSAFYFRATRPTPTTDDVALLNKIVGAKTFRQFKGYRADTYTTL